MLPIFRTISVGGVLLAITILALALSPPGGSRMQFASAAAPARGALIDPSEHPEWRHFLILAAVRRADELNRLHDLPDTPVRLPEIPQVAPVDVPAELPEATPKDSPKVAGLPAERTDADPDDETGSIKVAPDTTIPIEIGEPSSTELPVAPPEEPQVTGLPPTEAPEQVKPPVQNRKKIVQQRRARAPLQAQASAQNEAPIPFNLLQAFFESLLGKPPAASVKQPVKSATVNKPRIKAKRPAVIRSVSQ